jgi:hypothetical protein
VFILSRLPVSDRVLGGAADDAVSGAADDAVSGAADDAADGVPSEIFNVNFLPSSVNNALTYILICLILFFVHACSLNKPRPN